MLKFKSKLKSKQNREIPIKDLTWDIVESRDIAVERLEGLPWVKMFYDIDLKLGDKLQLDKEDYDRIKEDFFKILEKNAPVHDFVYTKHASREWRSSVDGKISTHIIFQKKYMSRSVRPETSRLLDHFCSTVLDGVSEENAKIWINAIDTQVYANGVHSDNNFRMAGKGDKTGMKTHHLPMNKTDPVSMYLLTPIEKNWNESDVLTLYSEVNVIESKSEEPKPSATTPSTRGTRGRPKKQQVESIPSVVLIKMFRALNAEKRAYAYQDWCRLLLLCKTLLGDEGLGVFLEISEASGYENYDEDEATSKYEVASPSGDLTEGTLIWWLKEDNPELLRHLCAEAGHNGREDCDLVYYKSYSVNFMKDLITILNRETLTLVRDSSGQIWCKLVNDPKYTNCWVPVSKQELSYRLLESRVSELKIAVLEKSMEGVVELSYVNKNLDFLQEKVFRYLHDFIKVEPNFDHLFESNLRKICFRNGVVDITTGLFSSWKMNPGIHTKVVIPIDYSYNKLRDEEIINTYLIPYFKEVFGEGSAYEEEEKGPERWEVPLMRFARILAGEYDKLFHVMQSKRNGGKTAVLKLLEKAFHGYVQTFNNGMITTQKINMKQDPTRELSAWVSLANSGCRFAYCQEIPRTEDEKSNSVYINSSLLKLLTGRDPLRARKMYQDDSASQTVRHQMALGLCCNTITKATDPDVWESGCSTKFPHQFLQPDKLDEYKENGAYNEDFHRLANPEKEQLAEKYALQVIHLVLRYYRSTLYPIDRIGTDGDLHDGNENDGTDETKELCKLLNSHFVKDKTGHISSLEISNFRTQHDWVFKRSDVCSKLEAMGAKKSIIRVNGKQIRGLVGLRYVPCVQCQSSIDEKVSQ